MTKKLDAMTVDELDTEHIRLKEEQPAHLKDRLREVKKVRDAKVEQERRRDRIKKLLINGAGLAADLVEEYVKTKTDEELNALIGPFEAIENQIGVVVTPETARPVAEGKEARTS